jgi:hypothetical protein
MRVVYLTVLLMELQGWPHISVAAVLQVGLEEQALDLAAFGLLLRLDLVERELEGTGGCQPRLKLRELDIRRGSVGRVSRERSCSCHILTVILP